MGACNWYLPGISYTGTYRVSVSLHRWSTRSVRVRVDILYKYMEIFLIAREVHCWLGGVLHNRACTHKCYVLMHL